MGRVPNRPIAILGAGQLARMLAQAAIPLGLEIRQLENSLIEDEEAVRRLLSECAIAVFENEFVDTELLARAARGLDLRFLPGLEVIHLLQDKLRQKKLLARVGVPSSEHVAPPDGATGESLIRWAEEASRRWPEGVVFKWAQLGYDGYGTSIDPDRSRLVEFLYRASAKSVQLFAERKVEFVRELAITASRSISGELAIYPLVISEQRHGACRKVTGPATRLGVDPKLEMEAREYASRISSEAGLVGTFAIEFFETKDAKLLVNELAPRVHNTSHYTLDAGMCSQFENHWRAVLDLPLGTTEAKGYFAMLNLMGPRDLKGAVEAEEPTALLSPGLSLHWYFKHEIRAGRKMGHLNARAESAEEIARAVSRMEEFEARWIGEILNGQKT